MSDTKGITCPHCHQRLSIWSVSPFNFADGLGWGTPIMHVCFNDECPLYVKAWNTMFDVYGRIGSQRYWFNPSDGEEGALPVAHSSAMRGDIIGMVEG